MLVYNLEVEDFHSYFVGCVPVLVHNYVAKSGNVYPEHQDYNYEAPTGIGDNRDFLHIHNTHPHAGVQPHTHSTTANKDKSGNIHYNYSPHNPKNNTPTTPEDYELLDFAITQLGWIENKRGGR